MFWKKVDLFKSVSICFKNCKSVGIVMRSILVCLWNIGWSKSCSRLSANACSLCWHLHSAFCGRLFHPQAGLNVALIYSGNLLLLRESGLEDWDGQGMRLWWGRQECIGLLRFHVDTCWLSVWKARKLILGQILDVEMRGRWIWLQY
jgi:hypothetical protein